MNSLGFYNDSYELISFWGGDYRNV